MFRLRGIASEPMLIVAQGYRVARPMASNLATQWLIERTVRGPAERTGLRVVGSSDVISDV